MKKCTKCGNEKPLDEFYDNERRPDGKTCQCKRCMIETSQIRNVKIFGFKTENGYLKKRQRLDFDKIEAFLSEKNIKMYELANATGNHFTQFSRWRRTRTAIAKIMKISSVMKVPFEELILNPEYFEMPE